jgi:hypothetical protein
MTAIEKKQDGLIRLYKEREMKPSLVFSINEEIIKCQFELDILKAREEKNPTHYERKFVEWLLNCADTVVIETVTQIHNEWELGAGKGASNFTTKQIYRYWKDEILKKKK